MVAATERLLADWRDGETRDIHREMMRLTLEVAAKALFGSEASGRDEEVSEAIQVLMEQFVRLIRFSPGRFLPEFIPTRENRRYRDAVGRLDRIVYSIIAERRANGRDTGDLLSLLLHAQDEDGSRMNDKQLRDEVMTLFLAGQDRKSTRLNSSHIQKSRMPSSA